jgi:hypothetical protein
MGVYLETMIHEYNSIILDDTKKLVCFDSRV